MNSDKRAVLFDLDGTLLDSLGDLAESMNAVLREDGLPAHPVDDYRYFIGEGVRLLVSRALPGERQDEASIETYLQRYRKSYEARWHLSKPFPGIRELLDALVKRGIPMAVVSNKPDLFTQQCVTQLFPSWPWAAVLGQSKTFPRKPAPEGALHVANQLDVEPARCLFVGDSDIDMRTGVNAGMTSVGVSWGFRPEKELKEAGAQHLIASPQELLALI